MADVEKRLADHPVVVFLGAAGAVAAVVLAVRALNSRPNYGIPASVAPAAPDTSAQRQNALLQLLMLKSQEDTALKIAGIQAQTATYVADKNAYTNLLVNNAVVNQNADAGEHEQNAYVTSAVIKGITG